MRASGGKHARWIAAIGLTLSVAACATATTRSQVYTSEPGQDYANFLIGRLASLRNDYQAASDRLAVASRAAPDDPGLAASAIASSLDAGDFARARDVSTFAAQHRLEVAYGDLVLGVDALAAGDWDAARARFAAANGAPAEQLTAQLLTGWAEAGDGRGGGEAQALSRLNLERPFSGVFAYQRAMLLDYAGDGAGARAAYDQALREGLWLPAALERQADLLGRLNARDAALAVLDPQRGAGVNPALAAARARLLVGQPVSAAPLTPARGAAIALYGLASLYLRESDFENGLATLTLALALDPDNDPARIAFAQAESDLGHPDSARAVLMRVPETSPYRVSAQTMLSWLDVEAGDEAGAIARLRGPADQGSLEAMRGLADLYRDTDHWAEAEPLYARLIAAQPPDARDWRLYFAHGAVLERLGRLSESEAELRQALALSPDQADVLNYLGYTLIDQTNRIGEGMTMIQRAAALRPASGAIVDSLGWAYFKQGDYPRALELLERAVQLEPADPTLNDHLGDAYWRVGRRIEARYQWRRALTFAPESSADRAAIESKIDHGLSAAAQSRVQSR